MMRNVKLLLPIALLLSLSLTAVGRIRQSWTYEQMAEQSDLVVIAKPISSSRLEEKTTLPNISPAVHVVGVQTKLDVRLVLEGWPKTKDACLHHYTLENPADGQVRGAAQLVTFDLKRPTCYLMFLKQVSAGRYEPVTGQTDPAAESIIQLESEAR
jgi:hypothetical protein